MNLYLVRHTTPDILPGICYGQSDIDVAQTFAHELEVVRSKLESIEPAVIYSSPLKRCSQLAAAIGDVTRCEVQHDPRLMELHFGDWELMAWNDIPRGLVDVWADDHVMQAPPAGESFHALSLRTKDFLQEVSANHSGQNLIVLTHAGVIRTMLAHALNMSLTDSFRLQVDYGSISQIVVENSITRVACVNR